MSNYDKEVFEAMAQTDEGKAFIEEQKKGLLNKRDDLLASLTSAQEELREYRSLGELDNLKSTMTQAQEEKQKEYNESTDWEAKEKYLKEQISDKENAFNALQNTFVQEKVTSTIKDSINKHKGDVEVLMPLLTQRVKGSLEDGKINVSVYDGDSVAHLDGERMTVDQLVLDIKSKHPKLFDVVASGSGTRPSGSVAKESATYDFNDPNFNLSKAAERAKKTGNYTSVTKKFGWR